MLERALESNLVTKIPVSLGSNKNKTLWLTLSYWGCTLNSGSTLTVNSQGDIEKQINYKITQHARTIFLVSRYLSIIIMFVCLMLFFNPTKCMFPTAFGLTKDMSYPTVLGLAVQGFFSGVYFTMISKRFVIIVCYRT